MTIETYVNEYMPAMGGWCSAPKALKIYDLIVEHRLKRGLEIGVFAGRSLCAVGLAMARINGKVDGVDPFTKDAALHDESQENRDWWARLNLEDVMKEAQRHVNALEIRPHCEVVRCTSREFYNRQHHDQLDFLHIDGNHSEWNSSHDVVMWVPEVRKGGIICMDDMDWPSTGTAQKLMSHQADFHSWVSSDDHTCAFFVKR